MPFGVKRAPKSNDPRNWSDNGMGWGPGAVVPWRWAMWSPGAYFPFDELTKPLVLARSVDLDPDNQKFQWQQEPVPLAHYYHLWFISTAQNEPTQTVNTINLQVYFEQLSTFDLWQGNILLQSPYPLQRWRIPLFTELPGPMPKGGLSVPWVEVYPVPSNTPVTPGNF